MGWARRVLMGALALVGAVLMILSSAVPARAAATTVNVAITDNGFDPPTLAVPVGTVVIWTNQGAAPHTVTAVDGSFASDDLQPGATFPFQFTKVGNFQYRDIHTGDVGTLAVVNGALQGTGTPAPGSRPQTTPPPSAAVTNPAGGPTMAFTGTGDWLLAVGGTLLLALGTTMVRRNPAIAVPFRVDPETAVAIERARRKRIELLPHGARRQRRRRGLF